jgi:hypothetical protein
MMVAFTKGVPGSDLKQTARLRAKEERACKGRAASELKGERFGSRRRDLSKLRSAESYTLSRRFWSKFADQNWEKQPLLIKRPFSKPLISGAELFRAILDSSEAYCADPGSVSLQFFVATRKQSPI